MTEKELTATEREAAWIRELASILTETGLTEIEIDKEDVRLRIARSATVAAAPQPVATYAAPAPHAAAPAAEPAPTEASGAPAASNLEAAIPSPMVGTAYLSPSPGATPFVKEGDQVKEGQTILIIEAMKTMNPITAPRSGIVSKVLIGDAQPVEFGEPLMIIE